MPSPSGDCGLSRRGILASADPQPGQETSIYCLTAEADGALNYAMIIEEIGDSNQTRIRVWMDPSKRRGTSHRYDIVELSVLPRTGEVELSSLTDFGLRSCNLSHASKFQNDG